METRVTRLETHMEYFGRDLAEIKGDLKSVVSSLTHLPTKRDLETWRLQWLAVGIAIVTLVVGGVVGGLALINHYAAAGPPAQPTPIVIQVPAPPQSAAPIVTVKPKIAG